jgi:hypothetical protein
VTAPLQPAEPTLTAAYMETCKDRPADHNEIGLFYFLQGWHKSRLAMKGAQQAPAAGEATEEQVEALDDLVTLVRRLVRALLKAAPTEALAGLALDYLERKGFNKGPFRSAVGVIATPLQAPPAQPEEKP